MERRSRDGERERREGCKSRLIDERNIARV